MKNLLSHLSEVEKHVHSSLKKGGLDGLKERVEGFSAKIFKAGAKTDVGVIGGMHFCRTDADDVYIASTAFKPDRESIKDFEGYLKVLETLGERYRFHADDTELCFRKLVKHAGESLGSEGELLAGFIASDKGVLCSLTYWGGKVDFAGSDALSVSEIADFYEEDDEKEYSKVLFGFDSF